MEYEKFKEQFVEDLKERLQAGGGEYLVEPHEVQKMTQTYEAVIIKPQEATIGVNLNLTEIHESYEDGMGSILVTNKLLDSYGITPEQLHADALQYAPVMRPAVIQTMAETRLEMMGLEAKDMIPVMPENPLFVASVPDKTQGAGVIAYQDFMDQAAERVGGDFFILPSSIHEVLLVKDDGNVDINNLEGIPLKSEMMRRWQRLWRASKNTEFSSLPLSELMSLAATSLFPVIEDTVRQSLREKRRCRVS